MYQRLVYVSRAVDGLGERDVYDIVRASHNRNCRDALTGAMLFIDRHFVQVLEGDRPLLLRRYQAIAADPRHREVQLRGSVEADELMFPDSFMALRAERHIPRQLRREFGYEPGLPAERFSAGRIEAFVRACWLTEPEILPAGPA